jgi:hypothetical protein
MMGNAADGPAPNRRIVVYQPVLHDPKKLIGVFSNGKRQQLADRVRPDPRVLIVTDDVGEQAHTIGQRQTVGRVNRQLWSSQDLVETLASAFWRADAEVETPRPWETSLGLRIHQGASGAVQRADDVVASSRSPRAAITTG